LEEEAEKQSDRNSEAKQTEANQEEKKQRLGSLHGGEEETCLTPWNLRHSTTISAANNSRTAVRGKNTIEGKGRNLRHGTDGKNSSKTLPATTRKSHRRSVIITTSSCHHSLSRQQHHEK
jgi:hypothetical protein